MANRNPKQERTYVMIKPDGVKKGLIGEVIKRFEQRDLKVVALEMFQPTLEEIDNHYPKDPAWIKRLGGKTLATYEYWRAQSSASPVLGTWRALFYPGGKKRIPENLVEILTEPLALAVWYMDDGYYNPKDHNSFLYLGRVSRKEAECAQDMLSKNFELSVRIYDKKNKGFALYFSTVETKKLHTLIRQHVVLPTFAYKLGDIP